MAFARRSASIKASDIPSPAAPSALGPAACPLSVNLSPLTSKKGSSTCALLLSQIPWFAGLLFRKRKEDDYDTTVYTYYCSWRRDCGLALYPASVRQSGPLLCPDHPGRRSGHLHRASQTP